METALPTAVVAAATSANSSGGKDAVLRDSTAIYIPHLSITPYDDRTSPDPPGEVLQRWIDINGIEVASGGRSGDRWWMHWPELATFHFGRTGDVVAQLLRPGRAATLRDVFSRAAVPVVLLARGCEGLHASAVRTDGGVIAFCGTSGTGKSTIALAVAATEFDHFADDAVVYRLSDTQPAALRLPFPVRVSAEVRSALGLPGELAGRIDPAGGCAEPHTFRTIYSLRRNAALDPPAPVFTRLTGHAAFEALLTHAHPFDMDGDGRRRTFLQNLLALTNAVQVWECQFAPSLDALPQLAAAIREHASTA